jgi:hypothetical protein
MPRHWQYLREKTPAIQKELRLRQGEQEETRMVLVGAVIALRDTMRLLSAQGARAAKARKEKRVGDEVLDLANFDCYACHHDLTAPSWRQRRGYRGKPGRVPMRGWSTELIKLAVKYLATVDRDAGDGTLLGQFDQRLKKVTAAFDARPYGEPALLEKAAGDLADWADKLAARMKTTYPDRRTAAALLGAIPPMYSRGLLDYDAARQVAWSYEVIFNELHGYKGGNASTRKLLGALDKELKLRLPKGRDKLIEDELDVSLKKINNYNPDSFRSLLLRIGKTGK